MKISIVLNNYNYAEYAQLCIESALAQSYPNTEIVVVDDGSTDNSWEILQQYRSRVILDRQKNGGQGAAYNRGYELSTGEIVCFLDSDDLLAVDACRSIAAIDWTGVTKVQGKLQIIDGSGKASGRMIPFGDASERAVHRTWARFGHYNSPPGSGNFYHRAFLEKTLPMDRDFWRISADACLILQAPFFGRVQYCTEIIGSYRIHGNNASAQNLSQSGEIDVNRYATKELRKELRRQSLVIRTNKSLGGKQCVVHDTPSMLKLRIARYRTSRRELRPIFYRAVLLKRTCYVFAYWDGYSLKKKAGALMWMLAATVLPKKLARRLVEKTIYPYKRGY